MSSGGKWTPSAMPDCSGQTVVVTGANTGIGFEAAEEFARKGAHVVLACRSVEKGENAAERIASAVPDATTEVLELDLASLDSVREFVATFEDRHDELHVLVNNAGVMFLPWETTEDGFQIQFGVNHLGHFALTGLLLDRLVETPGETRIVTVSSGLHERGKLKNLETIHDRGTYDKTQAYADSKLANVLFAYELQHRLLETDHEVKSVAVHPGYADTDLQRRGPEKEGSTLKLWGMKVANAVLAQSSEQGAWPTLFAATSPAIQGGEYVGPGGILDMRGPPTIQESSDRSHDADLAKRLWERSEEWTGVTFDLPERGAALRDSTAPSEGSAVAED